MRIMARRMMSAAVPWIGALIAWRRAKPPPGPLELISGVWILRPNSVSTKPFLARAADHAVHVGLDAGELDEILLDEGLGLVLGNAEVAGEAEARDAVDDAEVDRLGAAAQLGRHLVQGHAEHLGGGDGVDVLRPRGRRLELGQVAMWARSLQLDLV
jgi:hypothetical protein